jgi:radical SAM PhpK family P-methyltransferase
MTSRSPDCIVIGYHDLPFGEYAATQKTMERFSGAYRDIQHNSVRLDGARLTYMELLNHAMTWATGTDPRLNAFEVPSLGVTYLVSYLRRRGFDAEFIGFFNYEQQALADMLAQRPLAVAITTTYYVDALPLTPMVEFIRQHSPTTKVIVGGPHIYNISSQYKMPGEPDIKAQDYLLRSIGADIYIVDSQGEHTLSLVLSALKKGREAELALIPNLTYMADGRNFVRTLRAPEQNHLDEDAVDWDQFPNESHVFSFPVFLRASRSCPFSCAFCNFPATAGKHQTSSLDAMEKQFRHLQERGVKHILFIDDTFNVPLPRFKHLLRMMIRNRFDFEWISFFRCSNADEEAFELMAESGCKEVFLGIESGAQELLDNMNKFADIARYKAGIRGLNAQGINTYASFIVGFPGETADTVARTIELIEETEPVFYNVQMYFHDTRTPIHKQADKYGINGAGYCWQHRTMDWREAADWTDHCFASVRNSVPTTIWGFSIWVLPYLVSRGFSIEQVRQYLSIAREMLTGSFGDRDADFSDQKARLTSLFQGTQLVERPLAIDPA